MKLTKDIKYCIIGVSGSATASLLTYMKSEGYEVSIEKDWFWQKDKCYNFPVDVTPLIIMRNPLERAWSHFCSLPDDEYEHNPKARQRNLEYVSRLSSYDIWLNMWKAVVPTTEVVFYEDLIGTRNFPHERKQEVKAELLPIDTDMIENYIEMERSTPLLSRNIPQLLNSSPHTIE